MAKSHGKQIKDDEKYEKLREKGYSKEKSARIANAEATGNTQTSQDKRGKKYEDWTKEELYEKAANIGIEGRSDMTKKELINALRNH